MYSLQSNFKQLLNEALHPIIIPLRLTVRLSEQLFKVTLERVHVEHPPIEYQCYEIYLRGTVMQWTVHISAIFLECMYTLMSLFFNTARNPQMRQLGLPRSDQNDVAKINKHIDNLNFDFVLLVEYFDECIVLLKRKLCWDFESILHMKLRVMIDRKVHKSRIMKSKSYLNLHDLEATKTMLHNRYKNFSQADYILYERMNASFWTDYNKESDISDEVQHFKSVQKKVADFCALDPTLKMLNFNVSRFLEKFNPNSSQKLTLPKSKWNEAMTIHISHCLLYQANDNILRKIFK